ncbi:hypothetical protein ACIBCA_13645 [Kitasatospora sp. NPDC051170]|uniref:hypothetical protein n=1 Tax=Kitasatospora sp. NPDC051170 TaxID=3364056 RepID=UPI003795D37D
MRIRLPDRRSPGWWRKRLPAFAVVWAVVVAIGVAPIGLGAVTPAVAAGSSVTQQGPLVWLPAESRFGDTNGSVTVAQTKNLVNQMVHVSWTGFTPTLSKAGDSWTAGPDTGFNAFYQVRVYQCRGTDPKITDCYGSTLYNADAAKGFQQPRPQPGTTFPDFPDNHTLSVTGPDGSGFADVQLLTAAESPSLNCDDTHPCSIVVEPNYGGNALGTKTKGVVKCGDHRFDATDYNVGSDGVLREGVNQTLQFQTSEQCAWDLRVVVPVAFSPTPTNCPASKPAFSAAGLEPAKRAMDQWQTGLCQASDPMLVTYGYANGDQASRAEFLAGTKDLVLTARPDGQSPPSKPYVYAPVVSSGISVAFVVDADKSGPQIRDMKLNARLVAKLLTQSYNARTDVPSVKGNPSCIFDDPEFQKLNPAPFDGKGAWPGGCDSSQTIPTVYGGISDLTYQLTSWIASDPDAVRFLDGEYDPWGMHVDGYYLRPAFSGYPVDSFIRQDGSGFPDSSNPAFQTYKQFEWNPLSTGIKDAVRKIVQNRSSCVSTDDNGKGGHDPCVPQPVGRRTLFAVMDSAQAKAFALPEAQLLNAAGGFVSPDVPGFQSAVADMTVDPATGMQSLPYGAPDTAYSRDQKAYPLTTVDYAMLPTKGLSSDKVTAMTRYMRTVTTGGQVYGFEPGHLPPGFLALTGAQHTQANDAIGHLEAQDSKLPGNQAAPPNPPAPGDGGSSGSGGSSGGTPATQAGDNTGTASGGTSGDLSAAGVAGGTGGAAAAAGGAGAAAAGGKAAASPTSSGKAIAAAPVAAGTPAADRSGSARLLLPVALIGGLVLLVGGPAALFLGGTPAGERAVSGVRRLWARVARRP